MNTDKPTTTTASAQPTRIMPEQFRIASKALVYARNVTTNQDIFSQLGDLLNHVAELLKQIGSDNGERPEEIEKGPPMQKSP